MIRFVDLRAENTDPYPPKTRPDGTRVPQSKRVKNRIVVRDPSTITGVTLHQTACLFGPSNDIEKRNRRALGVPCHALAFRDGVVAIPSELTWYVYTSNGLNASTLGLEVEGRYPGLVGQPRTLWGGNETPLDALTIEAARAALRYLVEQGRAAGMPIASIYAHRQSNGTKRSDPGEGLWREVALWGVRELGLSTIPTATTGDGAPIPREWDPGGRVPY